MMVSETADRARNAEQIRWQRQAHAVLGRLLELAAEQDLPVITWIAQSEGASVVGECLAHPEAYRREHFTAWRAAITSATGCVPEIDREHGTGNGETRLVARWDWLPLGRGAHVTLTASIQPDEEPSAAGPADPEGAAREGTL